MNTTESKKARQIKIVVLLSPFYQWFNKLCSLLRKGLVNVAI